MLYLIFDTYGLWRTWTRKQHFSIVVGKGGVDYSSQSLRSLDCLPGCSEVYCSYRCVLYDRVGWRTHAHIHSAVHANLQRLSEHLLSQIRLITIVHAPELLYKDKSKLSMTDGTALVQTHKTYLISLQALKPSLWFGGDKDNFKTQLDHQLSVVWFYISVSGIYFLSFK